jgi:hypothetical protein
MFDRYLRRLDKVERRQVVEPPPLRVEIEVVDVPPHRAVDRPAPASRVEQVSLSTDAAPSRDNAPKPSALPSPLPIRSRCSRGVYETCPMTS